MGIDEPKMGDFEIGLLEIERDSDSPFDPETYKVVFEISRDGRSWNAAVWIEVGSVPTVDLIRTAMSMLHITLQQLATQTEAWRIEARP